MNKILYYLALCISVNLFLCCTTHETHQKVTPSQKVTTRNSREYDLDEIIKKLEFNIATIFFDSNKRPIIKVHIKKTSSNYLHELPLADYLYHNIKSHIAKEHQFSIVPLKDPELDCVVEIHIIQNYNGRLDLLNVIKDQKDNVILYAFMQTCKNIILSPGYLSYKKHYKGPTQEESTYLFVKAINLGESFEDYKERTPSIIKRHGSIKRKGTGHLREEKSKTKYKAGYNTESDYQTTSEYIRRKDFGTSAFYPANQMCIINGNKLKIDEKDIFYNDFIGAGTLEFVVSFQEGFWDAETKRQTLGEEHRKKFYLELDKGDDIKVEIIFVCKGDQKDINVKLYRKMEIKKGMFIEPYYDPIEQ